MRGDARTEVRMGRAARRVLTVGHGSVLAALPSALYLESAAGVACLAPPSTPCGPLNVILRSFDPEAPGRCGATWRADGAVLVVDGLGTFAVSPGEEWAPARVPPPCPTAVLAGVASMQTALATRAPRGEVLVHALDSLPEHLSDRGNGITARGTRPRAAAPGSPTEHPSSRGNGITARGTRPRAAAPGSAPEHPPNRGGGLAGAARSLDAHFARTVPALSRWLAEALSGDDASTPRPVADLLGAGRGLTPSGDDCIVGVLVALHALEERKVAAAVAHVVARYAPRRTTRLSAAHLDAACDGEAIEPVHAVIEAIAGSQSPERALDALERFGHGSGFDALAGVLLAAAAVAHGQGAADPTAGK